ncbi:MAG: flagellar biosynthetic protein FliO [Clostridia bacterium]|nr:flagellar biosynthetic protein FliO [Clostridia bacterium]
MEIMTINFIRVLSALVVFGSILFLVVVTTRYVGTKANKAMKGKFINIVETVSLGLDKHIYLVKVGEQFVLIASAGKNIEYLTTVKIDEYSTEELIQSNTAFDFKSFFDKYIQVYKNKKNEKKKSVDSQEEIGAALEGEVFKRNLDKLKRINKGFSTKAKEDGDENTNEN